VRRFVVQNSLFVSLQNSLAFQVSGTPIFKLGIVHQVVQNEEYLRAADTDIIRRTDQEFTSDVISDVIVEKHFGDSARPSSRRRRSIGAAINTLFSLPYLNSVGVSKLRLRIDVVGLRRVVKFA
jgi:hypothetical protein